MHDLKDRLASVIDMLRLRKIDQLLLFGNGHHMIDLDNPVAHMTGYRSVGPAALRIDADGGCCLLTSADEEVAVQDLRISVQLSSNLCRDLPSFVQPAAGAMVGFGSLPRVLAQTISRLSKLPRIDDDYRHATAIKTDSELAAARRATEIAEDGYLYLLDIAKPGMRECDLAIEINHYMRSKGANDSFLMLNCGPFQDAVMPSSERPIAAGDLLLCELSPSVDGQFTQICRTVSIGPARSVVEEKYPLLVSAMFNGIHQVKSGTRIGDVCLAIDDHLSAQGYAKFSRPPFIRRRGHGLGCGSTAPGDVSVDNDTLLKSGMLFMVHPNQFLPETGYMMCGEPVVCTSVGFFVLSSQSAVLAQTRI